MTGKREASSQRSRDRPLLLSWRARPPPQPRHSATRNGPNIVGEPNRAGPVAGNPACEAPSQIRTPQNWFNQCAFAAPATETFGPAFGTEGRNAVIGPPYADLDFSLSKSFAFRSESQRLQFRGESFDLPNHPNFDDPYHDFEVIACGPNNSSLCPTANYGAVLSSNAHEDKPPRQIQLSFKYVF